VHGLLPLRDMASLEETVQQSVHDMQCIGFSQHTLTKWLDSCGGCCTARKLCSDLSHIMDLGIKVSHAFCVDRACQGVERETLSQRRPCIGLRLGIVGRDCGKGSCV